MKHFTMTRTATVGVTTATALVLAGGVAYAFWSTTGSGTGAAASGSSLGLTLTAGTASSNVLYPTATGDVVVVISNPNGFAVSVDALTLPATAATAYTNAGLTTLNAACNTGGTGVSWNYASKSLTGVIVAKKSGAVDGTLTLTLTNAAVMSNASDSSCQNSFFKLPNVLTAPGSSSAGTPVASITQ